MEHRLDSCLQVRTVLQLMGKVISVPIIREREDTEQLCPTNAVAIPSVAQVSPQVVTTVSDVLTDSVIKGQTASSM